MKKLTRQDLYSLEEYASIRLEFKAKIMAHKKNRIVHIGANVALHFEDRLVMQYQVQEMLRAEKIFAANGIEEELNAYNPLIPDGSNWKATLMIEYDDENERRQQLAKLIGIEKRTWVRVDDFEPVYPIANEDLERTTEEKTSAVHFLRFELSPEMISAVKRGANIGVGIEHDHYHHTVDILPKPVRESLVNDLD